MELEHFPPDLPACVRRELGEGGMMYRFNKDEHVRVLLKQLALMQADEILTDLTVRTNSKDLKEPFHSMLLAASSPVIKRSLTGKRFDCTSGVISLDLTQNHLEAFRDFLYKSKLPSDQGMVDGFEQFARTHEIPYLEQLCQLGGDQLEGYEGMTVWSKYHEDVLYQLHDMRQKKELATTCLEDCEGSMKFAVHGPLIAAASPVFQDMFSGELLPQEGSSYRLKDVTCNTLGDLIEFIYTGEVTLEEENVIDLLHAACDYEIPTLARTCSDWLGLQLRPYNVVGIWSLARELHCEYTSDLEEVAKSYIIANFTSVRTEDEFLELKYEDLEEIIRDENLDVQNEEAFAAAVNWMRADEDSRSFFFCNLLQCICLKYTSLEFLRNMEKDPHVANCTQCLQTVQWAQEEVQAQQPPDWRAFDSTSVDTRCSYDEEADVKRYLLDEFLKSIQDSDDCLKEMTEWIPPRPPRKTEKQDMRLKGNRFGQLNIGGSPDMRFKVNRRLLDQRKVDGSPDRRFKGNKESCRPTQGSVSKTKGKLLRDVPIITEGPLTKDGKPDMRFKVNKQAYGQSSSQKNTKVSHSESERMSVPVKKDGTPDMRYAVNKTSSTRTPLPGNGSTPLKRDGTPDMRFAVNKQSASSMSSLSSFTTLSGPLKKDGTPDMRYTANKPLSASGYSSVRSSYSSMSLASLVSPGPLKSDGTPDMRYAVNRPSYASPSSYSGSSYGSRSSSSGSSYGGPLKSDGTPDMRYSANRSSYGSSSSYGGSSYNSRSSSSDSGFGGSGLCGPLKSDGTPDMRFAANRR